MESGSQKSLALARFYPLVCFTLFAAQVWGLHLAEARSKRAGVGAVLGRPQGLTVQLPIVKNAAVNASLYYNFERPRFDLHLDQIFIQAQPVLVAFYPYFGLGGRLSLSEHRGVQDAGGLTARVPIGLELGDNQLRAFIEVAPSFEVLPALGFTLHAAIGLRYHFL